MSVSSADGGDLEDLRSTVTPIPEDLTVSFTGGTMSADSTHNTIGLPPADVLALEHVLDNIYQVSATHPMRDCLRIEGIERISDLIGLSSSEIDELQIPKIFRFRLKKLLDWYVNQPSPSVAVWFTFTCDQYASYIPSFVSLKSDSSTSSSVCPSPDGIPSSFPAMSSPPQHSFLPGIKRQVNDYPQLKNDDVWFTFKRLFSVTAKSQGLWHVFNPDPDCQYVPVGEQQTYMFQLEQAFCFKVLVHSFQTVKSREFIRGTYADTNDAQLAFGDARKKYESSMDIMHLRTEKENTIKALYVNNSFKKSLEDWLEVWAQHVQDLEDNLDKPVSDIDKRAWLTASTLSHTQLSSAISTFATIEHTTNSPATFESFFRHLRGHAKTMDKTNKVSKVKSNRTKQVRKKKAKKTATPGISNPKPQSNGRRLGQDVVRTEKALHRGCESPVRSTCCRCCRRHDYFFF